MPELIKQTASTGPTLTDQQHRAIFTRKASVALSAGAGCGKTFVLTQRFLSHLEPGPESSELTSLAAITFTERAAREMRDRIRRACHERLQSASPDQQQHWLEVLREIESARISTIHSFCGQVLRRHAVEAGLDPQFATLDSPLATALRRRVARETFHSLLEEGNEDLEALVINLDHSLARSHLGEMILQYPHFDSRQFEEASEEDLLACWRTYFHQEFLPFWSREFTERWLRSEFARTVDPSNLPLEEAANRVRQVQSALRQFQKDQQLQPLTSVIDAHATISSMGKGSRGSEWMNHPHKKLIQDTFTNLREDIQDIRDFQTAVDSASEESRFAAEMSCRCLRLAKIVANRYEESKQSQSVLDFDDLLLKTRDLLRDFPDVRTKLSEGLDLLMVDEFQDTDTVQAEIVRMLCGEALLRGRLFLVGDRKQSIYGFRRADPSVFQALREEIPAEGRLPLTKNFRSQPDILHFVNAVFHRLMGEDYEALEPSDATQYSPQPIIEFLFAPCQPTENKKKGIRADAIFEEADWIARRIVELLEDPTPRVREGKGGLLRRVEARDIVILCRTLNDVEQYERALGHWGIDYYLSGGKTFFSQQEVYDVLNLCRYLKDPEDLVALVGVLRSPFFNLNDDTLFTLNRIGPNIRKALANEHLEGVRGQQVERVRFAQSLLQELRQLQDHVPLFEILRLAIDRTGYEAALMLGMLGSRRIANLRKVIEMAEKFEADLGHTEEDFVEYLDHSVLVKMEEEFATTLPEADNVVQIMTIHKAKGLEFPIVFVADLDRKPHHNSSQLILHPELGALMKLSDRYGEEFENIALKMANHVANHQDSAESIRLFYVAATRAADLLILSAGYSEGEPNKNTWLSTLSRVFNLSTGLPVGDPLLGTTQGLDRETIPPIRVHHHAPEVTMKPLQAQRQPRLSAFREMLAAATPESLPESAKSYSHSRAEYEPFSVSELEEYDDAWKVKPSLFSDPEDDISLASTDLSALGILVHRFMQRVDVRRWKDVAEQWQQFVAPLTEDPHVIEDARVLIERFAHSQLARQLASARKIFREVPFAIPFPTDPNLVISGTIDCLIHSRNDEWMIWDYKTGFMPSRISDSTLLATYGFQLATYAWAVESWIGRSPSEFGLIGFRPAVRYIRWEITPAYLSRVPGRILSAVRSARKAEAAPRS